MADIDMYWHLYHSLHVLAESTEKQEKDSANGMLGSQCTLKNIARETLFLSITESGTRGVTLFVRTVSRDAQVVEVALMLRAQITFGGALPLLRPV